MFLNDFITNSIPVHSEKQSRCVSAHLLFSRVIPNAIQINVTSESGSSGSSGNAKRDRYFFTSFSARDKTYLMLFRVWQNALLDQPMSLQELWQWVHFCYGEGSCGLSGCF